MAYRISQEVAQKGRLSQKQTQRLMMSPEMQQALHWLQLPVLELSQALEEAMEANPVLDLEDESEEGNEEEPEEEDTVEGEQTEVDFNEGDFSILSKIDDEFSDLVLDPPRQMPTREDEKRQAFVENSIADEPSLFEYLMIESQEIFENPEDLKIAEVLIGYLDEHGLLKTPLKEIAAFFPYSLQDLERAQLLLQTLDPPGIAASSLQEALLIQLKRQKKEGTLAYQIVEKHYDDLLHNRIPNIQKGLKASTSEISQAIETTIAKLDNHPGLSLNKNPIPYITPDVRIEEVEGSLEVIIAKEPLPALRLNHKYLKMLEGELAPETRKFIEEKIQSAKWLMKTVKQRESTLERIVKSLVQKDRDFFLSPEGKMKPLTMKTLSEELELHESTIARAVQNKYLSCPRGTLPLRSFFTSTFVASDGEKISSRTIKDILKSLIDNEDKSRPLSDEALSKIIQGKGIECARRTVAKFRSALSLGNQHQRRKFTT
jgi:RNA polymerase sigma-54 factor